MAEYLDIGITLIINLLISYEFDQANKKVHEAINKMNTIDFESRQKKSREIIANIYSLRKTKNDLLQTVADFPESVQFHAKEIIRPLLEEVDKNILQLLLQKKRESLPYNRL